MYFRTSRSDTAAVRAAEIRCSVTVSLSPREPNSNSRTDKRQTEAVGQRGLHGYQRLPYVSGNISAVGAKVEI